ncbi:putative holin-like toxin [Brevibacillus dissolubilis]
MTVFESISLAIGFGTMVATIIIGVMTVVVQLLSNRKDK